MSKKFSNKNNDQRIMRPILKVLTGGPNNRIYTRWVKHVSTRLTDPYSIRVPKIHL